MSYDIQAIIEDLQKQSEIIPDEHDGSYEAMRETIKAYSRMPTLSAVDIPDLNLVYLTSVGTWRHGIDSKKKLIRESSLPDTEQDRLIAIWDKLWKKACSNQYDDGIVNGKYSIGMFGTGFMSFEGKSNKKCAEAFIQLCVDILPLSIDEEMYQKTEQVLTASFAGMGPASASMVLHCLKPGTFPIMNSNMGNDDIFGVLGIDLDRPKHLETYISNTRKITAFRNEHFHFLNYRVFDKEAHRLREFEIAADQTSRQTHKSGDLKSDNYNGEEFIMENEKSKQLNRRMTDEEWTKELKGNTLIMRKTFDTSNLELLNYGFVIDSETLHFLAEICSSDENTETEDFDIKLNLYDADGNILKVYSESSYHFSGFDTFDLYLGDIDKYRHTVTKARLYIRSI